jgi:predicted HAD superfamily hydrolase
MRTFDLFDTIVFRTCGHPENVFSFSPNLLRKKINAPTLQQIYDQLREEASLSEAEIRKLMDEEMRAEWKQIEQVVYIVNMLEEDDIIVSDMYLPFSFLQRVVREKCGLQKKLIVSDNGKHSGSVWSTLPHRPKLHLGDNLHSDVASPRKAGMYQGQAPLREPTMDAVQQTTAIGAL